MKALTGTALIFSRMLYYYFLSFITDDNIPGLKQKWAQETLEILGFTLTVHGSVNSLVHDSVQNCARGSAQKSKKNLILVGNHIGFIDIVVLFAVYPQAVFLAKSQVRYFPLIGSAARRIGTYFVDRGSRRSRSTTKLALLSLLQNSPHPQNIAVFPSGTTCLNEELPWKRGMFEVARLSGTPVQPFKVFYSHSRACSYVGRDNLLQKLFGLFSVENKKIDFYWGPQFEIYDLDLQIEETRRWTQRQEIVQKPRLEQESTNSFTQL